jgi:hypothetical protein
MSQRFDIAIRHLRGQPMFLAMVGHGEWMMVYEIYSGKSIYKSP